MLRFAQVTLPSGKAIPTVLLGNKADQTKTGLSQNKEEMHRYCQERGFSAWYETSAKVCFLACFSPVLTIFN